MRSRTVALAVAAVVALAVGFALVPVRAEQIHRHGFGGRHTVLVRGDANVRVDVVEHDISALSFKSQPSSEHIKLTCDAATGDAAYIYYYYDTPPAPISEVLSAGVWVKATKKGIQLRARVVFPKEPDPANPQSALTALIVGTTYEKSRSWDKLTLENVPELLGKHLPVLRAKVGRDINTTGAYIDRLVLNLYAGPGTVEVWVDDLDIGPVKPAARPDAAKQGPPGVSTKQPRDDGQARGRLVEQRGGQITVDGKPFFFRAIRHTGTPLHVLRQAGFDTLWLPPDAPGELLEDANREGWLVIPTIPLTPARAEGETREALERISADLDPVLRKFGSADVLFYDLGGGRTADQYPQVARTAEVIRTHDPRRPRGIDVWDGFQAYSGSLDVVGAHRWPLFTSLGMDKYRDWLAQRKTLTAYRATFWTWVQNHLPDWYVETVLEQKPTDPFYEPIGPHPEQVRVMAHIALASGCRGLGFWSDRFLADSHHGRDRLQGMALLNAEIDMLSPCLLAPQNVSKTQWLNTNNPNVKAALVRGERGAVLLPIWFGPGMQFVPDQGAIAELKVTVPLVHDGADPWRITPAGVECLAHKSTKVVGGTELTIPEFDLVAPVVFTNDRPGLVVWWQDYARKYGRLAARWALDMAAVEYEKVATVHNRLAAMNVKVRDADVLFKQSVKYHESARQNFAAELYDKAYADATRALRPLRVIMRDHWNQATATLDTPTASPYAISYFTLPKHWELFAEVQRRKPGANALPHGNFELNGTVPAEGAAVNLLPGWSARYGTLDRVNVAAGVVPSAKLAEKPQPRKGPEPVKGMFAPGRPVATPDEGYVPPTPELGRSLLRLEVRHRVELDQNGKPLDVSAAPLEKTFLAVDSPPVRFAPGTLVRVSGWLRVPQPVGGSVDGVLFYDDAGGEQLGVRVSHQPPWKKFHLYRRVPASGQISVTLALTGIGAAYFDDIRIEPLVPTEGGAASGYGSTLPAGSMRR
jgi:hypothetical protein